MASRAPGRLGPVPPLASGGGGDAVVPSAAYFEADRYLQLELNSPR
jgi:hypothetical protein